MNHKPATKSLTKKSFYGFILLIILVVISGCGGIAFIYFSSRHDYNVALEKYREESHHNSLMLKGNIENIFNTVYHGIRTISKLPSVRRIDRHATNLSQDDKIAIQELYNNLASSVSMSEVYIVHGDFNPEAFDPVTGENEAPSIMFDELIVGRTLDDYLPKKDTDQGRAIKSEEIEEVEIFEYHLIKSQIQTLKASYPTLDKISGLKFPAVSGKEVLTCDNTRYSPGLRNDEARSGLVYSLPFYDMDGGFKGVISAIFLTDVLRDIIGARNYALVNTAYNQVVLPNQPSVHLQDEVKQITASSRHRGDALYSEMFDLNIIDGDSRWQLWALPPDAAFKSSTDVQTISRYQIMGYIAVFIITLSVVILILLVRRNFILENIEFAEAKEKAEASNQAKTLFFSNISHELRTPMHAILNYANLGLKNEDALKNEKLTKYLSNIVSSGQRLLGLLDNLLDLSRMEAGKMDFRMKANFISSICDDSLSEIEPLMRKKEIKIKIFGKDKIADIPVICDKLRMQQVFINLLSNAVKFSPDRSHIEINFSTEFDKTSNKQVVRCGIADSGIGIPAHELESIFDKFVQSSKTRTGAGGTGLGLSICREIIEAHKGRIWAESRSSGGTIFYITLPCQHDNTRPPIRG